jgi:N,N-dimethylformamidase
VVLTGTHPEYVSAGMLDALEAFLAGGGRLMYLGGNGFYWVISFDRERPHILEVRKQGGTRAWDAGPGEHHHSTTGELGGIWQRRGRPPQKLVGVGFSAQGFDQSSYFERLPDSYLSETAFIFDGVALGSRFGDHGLVGGGAAGLELDRYDQKLGSPPDAYVVATSLDHTDTYTRVVEEVTVMRPGLSGSQDADVRADVVYFRTAGGGAVFSTGSIAWCTSLPTNAYRNDIAKITHNVLEAFLGDALSD